jgi:hypothetical protein
MTDSFALPAPLQPFDTFSAGMPSPDLVPRPGRRGREAPERRGLPGRSATAERHLTSAVGAARSLR